MFEAYTYEELLKEKLSIIDSKYDKREGSIIYDALAPNSAEDAQIYTEMEWMYAQQHGETADRESLVEIAKDTRGLEPHEATYAVLKGIFDIAVEIGSRFSLEDLNYEVIELINDEEHSYKLQCETVGEAGNKLLGTLIPINYIAKLTSAELTEVLVYGSEEEDTECFRQRWRDSFNSASYGGNKAAYKNYINEISGVGGVKVERATNQSGQKVGGHVRCTVISSSYGIPSTDLINQIQTEVDPIQNSGDGDGMAPIGASVYIQPVKALIINVNTTLTLESGYSFAGLKEKLESAIDEYFFELKKSWESNDSTGIVVRVSRLESALLTVNGVVDVVSTTVNGNDKSVSLDMYSIPVRGGLNG